MGKEIILFPLAAMGHLNPMVEFGKLLLHHTNILSLTILISQSPSLDNRPINSYIASASNSHPNLRFHRLPAISPSNPDSTFLDDFHLALPHLETFLSASSARAIVLDFFFDAALPLATQLNLPCYFFFASNASNLAAFLHLPKLHEESTASFKDLGDTPIRFPGFPAPIPASDMPMRISDRTTNSYKAVITQYERLAKSDGIIVNSFREFEPKALRSLVGVAPVFCVGPVTANGRSGLRHESLAWLDGQPGGSVVFLCFGTMGSAFSDAQVREIAVGLEGSGRRFLWVVRGSSRPLPEGFEERTRGRGLVVRAWAPQVEVLGHAAVGGFVTHCGWNSALEAIVAGVAMIAWPLYAEQRMNKVFLVEEAGLAVGLRGYKDGIVGAGEVEERVRWLMETAGGGELRARAAAAGGRGRAALREGGSSWGAMEEIVRLVSGADAGGLSRSSGEL